MNIRERSNGGIETESCVDEQSKFDVLLTVGEDGGIFSETGFINRALQDFHWRA
jgi:hypothetical protein